MTEDREINGAEAAAEYEGAQAAGGGRDAASGSAEPVGPEPDGAAEPVGAETDELRSELEDLNDRYLRLAAEFDNYRKRSQRDRDTMAARLQAQLVGSLLDVLDDLQRVEESGVGREAESVLEGVRLVEKKLLGVLEGAGLSAVEAEDAPFDPEQMEAVAAVPTADPELDHRVADVFQRGYRFRDILIRPARVRVWQYEESGGE